MDNVKPLTVAQIVSAIRCGTMIQCKTKAEFYGGLRANIERAKVHFLEVEKNKHFAGLCDAVIDRISERLEKTSGYFARPEKKREHTKPKIVVGEVISRSRSRI
jgi:hypothetical protein